MDAVVLLYAEALKKNNHVLSKHFVIWAVPILQQSGNEWSIEFLARCAEYGNTEDMVDLINEKIDLDNQDVRGWTALHIAAYYGNLNMVTALVEKKRVLMSAVATWLGISSWTALDVAIWRWNPNIVANLLDYGASSSSHDTLHLAITHYGSNDALEKVEYLLVHGWNITTQDNEGKTLLDVACNKGDTALVYFLENYQTMGEASNSS
ncbi:hypothetical protein C0993_010606 [Termitomyces sp. T159_Od127]|nr:hypothetical protein C0993_010606 [Termitomyces sp. T159_Od127]